MISMTRSAVLTLIALSTTRNVRNILFQMALKFASERAVMVTENFLITARSSETPAPPLE